jgi:hypothetical protein
MPITNVPPRSQPGRRRATQLRPQAQPRQIANPLRLAAPVPAWCAAPVQHNTMRSHPDLRRSPGTVSGRRRSGSCSTGPVTRTASGPPRPRHSWPGLITSPPGHSPRSSRGLTLSRAVRHLRGPATDTSGNQPIARGVRRRPLVAEVNVVESPPSATASQSLTQVHQRPHESTAPPLSGQPLPSVGDPQLDACAPPNNCFARAHQRGLPRLSGLFLLGTRRRLWWTTDSPCYRPLAGVEWVQTDKWARGCERAGPWHRRTTFSVPGGLCSVMVAFLAKTCRRRLRLPGRIR